MRGITSIREEAATIAGFATLAAMLALGARLAPDAVGYGGAMALLFGLFVIMLWCAFAVVRHAECLATLLGEPYGTLILTLAVIGIEVALISSVMLAGSDKPTLARDTMFSVLMIVLHGLVGLSLIVGGLRHRKQDYNLQGANAFLSVLLPLAALSLILPSFTPSAPGGELSTLHAGFLIVMTLMLYGIFLAIQTTTHSSIFRQPVSAGSGDDDHHHEFQVRSVAYHAAALIAALLPIVLLSKQLALYVDFGIDALGAPLALGGFLVAALVLTPEAMSAIQAARANRLQRAVNICLGSALATIGLTVPAVLIIGWVTGERVVLGLDAPDIVLLSLTMLISMVTFASARTHVLLGAVHLALFCAYVVLIFDTA